MRLDGQKNVSARPALSFSANLQQYSLLLARRILLLLHVSLPLPSRDNVCLVLVARPLGMMTQPFYSRSDSAEDPDG